MSRKKFIESIVPIDTTLPLKGEKNERDQAISKKNPGYPGRLRTSDREKKSTDKRRLKKMFPEKMR